MSGALTYTRYELLRTFRNRRFFILSLGFPLVLYFVIAGPNRGVHDLNGSGVSLPLYFMVGLASFGTMSAMLSSGARIAAERAVGWNRQLRISPLSPRTYFRAKVLTAYAMALLSIAVIVPHATMPTMKYTVAEMPVLPRLCTLRLAPAISRYRTSGNASESTKKRRLRNVRSSS